jgi:aflatoxin B1 aldehyde reductase
VIILNLKVILGLMTFVGDKDAGARITDLEQFKSCLNFFQRQGYDEVDTAYSYVGGKQQAFTKAAGWKERGFKIATK